MTDVRIATDVALCPICGRDSCKDHLPPSHQRQRLLALHNTFCKWLSESYDLDAIDAVLATAAAERLDGDPLWLLLISGSGNTKTETVCALSQLSAAIITSTITSEGALLSGSAGRDRAKDASGGLLRRIGRSGILIIKDLTSILSMDRHVRAAVLAGLREVHDGRWERNVGSDGGRTLAWNGRIAVIGACTTAWDRAYDVIASMADRFVTIRMNSSTQREIAGLQAIKNTGRETKMRTELAAAVATVLRSIDLTAAAPPCEAETRAILAAADVVTLCRTGVDYAFAEM